MTCRTVFLLGVAVALVVGVTPSCKPMREIYADSKDMCNRIFGDAFVYTTDESKGYRMNFDTRVNPNDAVTAKYGLSPPPTECYLAGDYHVLPRVTPQNTTTAKECFAWHDASCCGDKIASVPEMRDLYGPTNRWDRCAPMSSGCERFFVQEACFYECEPSVGLWRTFPRSLNETFDPSRKIYNKTDGDNTWDIMGMPIAASYCDAWFRACQNDMMCDKGDFFADECSFFVERPDGEVLSKGAIAGIVIGGVVVVVIFFILICFICVMIRKEKQGKPVFTAIPTSDDSEAPEIAKRMQTPTRTSSIVVKANETYGQRDGL